MNHFFSRVRDLCAQQLQRGGHGVCGRHRPHDLRHHVSHERVQRQSAAAGETDGTVRSPLAFNPKI